MEQPQTAVGYGTGCVGAVRRRQQRPRSDWQTRLRKPRSSTASHPPPSSIQARRSRASSPRAAGSGERSSSISRFWRVSRRRNRGSCPRGRANHARTEATTGCSGADSDVLRKHTPDPTRPAMPIRPIAIGTSSLAFRAPWRHLSTPVRAEGSLTSHVHSRVKRQSGLTSCLAFLYCGVSKTIPKA
jgi:hypothetical protein